MRPEEPGLERKSWIILLSSAAAIVTATAVALVIRRARLDRPLASVPELITDCYEKIKEIEADLSRLRAPSQPMPQSPAWQPSTS